MSFYGTNQNRESTVRRHRDSVGSSTAAESFPEKIPPSSDRTTIHEPSDGNACELAGAEIRMQQRQCRLIDTATLRSVKKKSIRSIEEILELQRIEKESPSVAIRPMASPWYIDHPSRERVSTAWENSREASVRVLRRNR